MVAVENILAVDVKNCMEGRGAYLCKNRQCLARLMKMRKKLAHALRIKDVTFDKEIVTRLEKSIEVSLSEYKRAEGLFRSK